MAQRHSEERPNLVTFCYGSSTPTPDFLTTILYEKVSGGFVANQEDRVQGGE